MSLTVKNTGHKAGQEVVQLYIHDRSASLPRPPKELKGFHKILLQPEESQQVSFTLNRRALSFYDPKQVLWVAEPGEFDILVGSSSRDIRVRGVIVLER